MDDNTQSIAVPNTSPLDQIVPPISTPQENQPPATTNSTANKSTLELIGQSLSTMSGSQKATLGVMATLLLVGGMAVAGISYQRYLRSKAAGGIVTPITPPTMTPAPYTATPAPYTPTPTSGGGIVTPGPATATPRSKTLPSPTSKTFPTKRPIVLPTFTPGTNQ